MATSIKDKIKAILAKCGPDTGATEQEQASALAMAQALMMKHNLSPEEFEEIKQEVQRGELMKDDYLKWHIYAAEAVGILYNCRPSIMMGKKIRIGFIGLPENIDACEMTFLWVATQIERLYKEHLPPGLDKATRAELRRTFKQACAIRVRSRAWSLAQSMASDDTLALETTGSAALVVRTQQEQMQQDIQDFVDKSGGKDLKLRASKTGLGTHMGFRAGDRVKLRQEVKVSRLQIGVEK